MTKVRTYRINVDENARRGDAIVLGDNGCMTSQHLGTAASFDVGVCASNIPIVNNQGTLPDEVMSPNTMKKCVYDKCCINDDAFDYNNFYNTPEIPVVNDPVVTFTQGGVTMGSISLNQAGATEIELMSGGVTAGSAIDINCNVVSVDYDDTSIGVNACDKLEVKDYSTIVSGAAAGATAVQANDLATVAMSGKYCDLTGKPEIPSAQIQSDWNQTNTDLADYIKNKPTIGDATITIQKNGTNVDCFTLNQTANKCLNIVLDKCDVGLCNVDNTSDADKPVSTAMCTALSCKQDNITDLGTIRSNACAGKTASETIANYGDIVEHDVCEFATATQGGKADTAVQPGDLCTVAISGKYCDLTGTPTIPTDNCELANGCNYITNAVSDLSNYYLKCETYTKSEVDTLISNFGGFEVVSVLPTTDIKTNVIYLLGPIGTGSDRYEEYIYYNNTWTKIGETSVDLSNYALCSDIPTDNCQLTNGCGYTTCIGTLVASDLEPYAKSCDLCAVATSGKYCDLTGTPTLCDVATTGCYTDLTGTPTLCAVATSGKYCDLSGTPSLSTVATSGLYCDLEGKPTIPTKVSQLSNDCNFIDKSVNNLDNYTPTNSLSEVATSGAYCDLTGKPTLACVACSGSYEDLCCKPNLGVYQTTANMVCDLTGADNSHYPSAKAVADALSCAGAGDMLSSMYDPCGCCGDAFDYSKLHGTPNLCTVATSGKYCDLTGTPTIPAALSPGNAICITNNCINVVCDNSTIKKNDSNQLYADFTGLATTASLCAVATSGMYCDLTGAPTIPTDNCQLANSCGYTTCTGTLVANDLNPYTKSCDLCAVATSGKYCDLTGTPTIPAQLTNGTGICIEDNKINAQNLFVINEDAIDVTYTGELGVDPYNASYCYTNVCINPNCGIKWIEGATYIFNLDTKVATSACRNVRLKIGDGDYIPLMGTSAVAAGSSYFVKAAIRPFQYSTKYQACGGLHVVTDSNTTYSAMSVAEGKAGTCTACRSVRADYLKQIIQYYNPTDNCQLANGCGYTTCTGTLSSCSDIIGALGYTPYNSTNPNGYTTCTGTLNGGDLVTVNGCCLVGSGDICIQGGVTSVNGCTGAVCVCEVPSGGNCGQVLQRTADGCGWATISLAAGDMCYNDFNFVSKSGATVTLDLSSTITPTANFTVNVPSEIKEGQAYVLRVNSSSTAYTMTLGTGITNPFGVDLTLEANTTSQFIFYATSSSALELQNNGEDIKYVTQAQYEALPSSKLTNGISYFIYEVEE